MKKIIFVILFLFAFHFIGCQPDDPGVKRAYKADKAKGDIIVGICGPWSALSGDILNGMKMAQQEINDSQGLLNKRKLRFVIKDDKNSIKKALVIAQDFANNEDMVAVIGHYHPNISVKTSIIYEYYKLLMLTTISSNSKLTRHGFSYVFRAIPDITVFEKYIAKFCKERGYEKIVLYHGNNFYGRKFSDEFQMDAALYGLTLVDRMSYDWLNVETHIHDKLLQLKNEYIFDAIILADKLPKAAIFINQARKMNINAPIIGGSILDKPEILKLVDKNIKDVYVATVFNPYNPNKTVKSFVKKYLKKYGKVPDTNAALGYDSVKLLSHAIKKAGSTVPSNMAEALRNTKNWKSVIGELSIEKNGDVRDNGIFFKAIENGKFKHVLYKD